MNREEKRLPVSITRWGVVRLKRKAWFFGGAALGLAIPIAIRVYERVLMLGEVRPIVRWLFWPTSLFLDFGPWTALRWEGDFTNYRGCWRSGDFSPVNVVGVPPQRMVSAGAERGEKAAGNAIGKLPHRQRRTQW